VGFGVQVSYPLPDGISGKQIIASWHLESPELAALERQAVEDRTPVDTGALREDIAATPYVSTGTDTLVKLYTADSFQEAEWHRIYVAYQEGGLLGLPTYTNEPHEMFAKVATEDTGIITTWAQNAAQHAVEAMTNETPTVVESFGDI
jgi:hypothetical protein